MDRMDFLLKQFQCLQFKKIKLAKIVFVGLISVNLGCQTANYFNRTKPNQATLEYFHNHGLSPESQLIQDTESSENLDNGIQISLGNKNFIKIFHLFFENKNLAIQHLMNRRVMLSSIFQNYVEPYYGLVEKKQCVDSSQFNSDFISNSKNDSLKFLVRIPVDLKFNPFDCDKGTPPLFAQYKFLFCQKTNTVFEIREYSNAKDLNFLTSTIDCL